MWDNSCAALTPGDLYANICSALCCGLDCASSEESLGDDDRDFDFGGHTAQKDLQGLMLTEGTYVRCNWIDPEEEEKRVNTWQKDKKAKVDPESEETALTGLQAAASTCTHFQLRGPRYPERWQETKEQEASQKAFRIMRAISDSLINRLMVLRIDNFPGSGDPVFGTKHELRRSLRAPDLFGKLTTAFQAGTRCCLKRVTLQGGFHSAASVANFLRVAKPPLESFRCRGCLFHGRNFEMLVKALSGACAGTLLEFETDAAIGGRDPFGFLADSFPQLRMLRAKCVFGKTENLEALKRLNLKKKLCKLPKEDHRLRGRPAVNTKRGVVYWFISSDHHDDGYRGQGLWWDELDNTCECMEEWRVGKGVTQKKCLTFMEECGIDLDPQLSDEDCGMDSDTGSADSVPDGEQDIVWNRLVTGVPHTSLLSLKEWI